MKWSRLAYCAVFMALLTLFVVRGISPWITVPLGALAAYWTYHCTVAVWHVASFRVAVWRANLFPPERLWWLANPQLDPAMDIAAFVGVPIYPILLWLPLLIHWLLG
jgi:hypothetical protein